MYFIYNYSIFIIFISVESKIGYNLAIGWRAVPLLFLTPCASNSINFEYTDYIIKTNHILPKWNMRRDSTPAFFAFQQKQQKNYNQHFKGLKINIIKNNTGVLNKWVYMWICDTWTMTFLFKNLNIIPLHMIKRHIFEHIHIQESNVMVWKILYSQWRS